MKIKYSPVKWSSYALIDANSDTKIVWIDDNTISIDNDLYEFNADSVIFPYLCEITNGVILDAYRDEIGELYVTVRRFYTNSCEEWDTGEYHEINR